MSITEFIVKKVTNSNQNSVFDTMSITVFIVNQEASGDKAI